MEAAERRTIPMRRLIAFAMIFLTAALTPAAQAQQERKTPYWASISASEALMRTGPGKTYPAKWLYRRADLPIKVLEVYPSWRKVQDPAGETGWMLVNLLSDRAAPDARGTEHELPNPLRRPTGRRRAAFRMFGRLVRLRRRRPPRLYQPRAFLGHRFRRELLA
jgi:hypothetical protein